MARHEPVHSKQAAVPSVPVSERTIHNVASEGNMDQGSKQELARGSKWELARGSKRALGSKLACKDG